MAGVLDGRLALITGAGRGIGREVSRAFAKEGAHVIALARTVGALEELDDEIKALGGHITLVPLDLADGGKIDQLGVSVQQRFGKLDILVANAGVLGDITPMAHVEPHIWETVMAVNATANYRLIRILDPLLRASDAGRAIFVSSGAADGERPFWGPYAASKAALEALVRSYAWETRKTGLRVNLLDPGPTRTGMRAAAYPGEDPATLPDPQAHIPHFLKLAAPDCAHHGDILRCRQG